MSRFFDDRLARLTPYTPGEQPQDMKYIKLNTNESPFPPSPDVVAALCAGEVERLCLYPDPEAGALVSAIARYYGVDEAMVITGNGSDELLAFSFMAFAGSGRGVCFPDISYGFYPVYASLMCLDAREIPLGNSLELIPEDYYGAGRTIFIANPNAPTGMALSFAEIEGIILHNRDSLVVIDEAYIDFGGESVAGLTKKYDNLLVIGTMSKSRSLAGMRLGYAIGCAPVIGDLNTIKFSFNPYNINRLAILAGTAAMNDVEYFKRCTLEIQKNRAWTTDALESLGFTVLPSKANFIFARHEMLDGGEYYERLKSRGILVRHFTKPRIRDHVRITIGTQEQMSALIDATKIIMEELKP